MSDLEALEKERLELIDRHLALLDDTVNLMTDRLDRHEVTIRDLLSSFKQLVDHLREKLT